MSEEQLSDDDYGELGLVLVSVIRQLVREHDFARPIDILAESDGKMLFCAVLSADGKYRNLLDQDRRLPPAHFPVTVTMTDKDGKRFEHVFTGAELSL